MHLVRSRVSNALQLRVNSMTLKNVKKNLRNTSLCNFLLHDFPARLVLIAKKANKASKGFQCFLISVSSFCQINTKMNLFHECWHAGPNFYHLFLIYIATLQHNFKGFHCTTKHPSNLRVSLSVSPAFHVLCKS